MAKKASGPAGAPADPLEHIAPADLQQVVAGTKVVIALVSTSWCGPCKMLKQALGPVVRAWGEDIRAKVRVVVLDGDDPAAAKAAALYHVQVTGFPAVLVFRAGALVGEAELAPFRSGANDPVNYVSGYCRGDEAAYDALVKKLVAA